MTIDCYISQSCTSLEQLKANIEQALENGGIQAEAFFHRISDEEATEMNLAGSPTILVNGYDVFPGGIPGFA